MITVAVMKIHDQKQVEEEFIWLAYPELQFTEENQARNAN